MILTAILLLALVLCVGVIYDQHRIILRQQKRLFESLEWIDPAALVVPEDVRMVDPTEIVLPTVPVNNHWHWEEDND